MRLSIFIPLPPGLVRIACASLLAFQTVTLMTEPANAQSLSRAEKLEGKLRVAIVKATKDVHGPLIKASELLKILDDTGLVLIDIRQPVEQAVSMLPHALTTAEFAEKFRKGIPKGKRLVVYCTIGYRSGKYAAELARQGIQAENLEGGVLAWSFAGGPFLARDANGAWTRTNRIHVYDSEWNIVHPDYVGVF